MSQLRTFVAVAAIFVLASSVNGQKAPGPQVPAMTGVVVGPDGKPATGADVLLVDGYLPLDADGHPMVPPGKKRHHGRGAFVRGRGKADAEGRFQIEVRGEAIEESDRVVLWAHKPGSLASSTEVKRLSLTNGTPARIRLEPPSETTFRVFGPDGNPVAGARVVPTVLSRDALSPPEELGGALVPATNAEGEAVTTALRPGEVRVVRVSAFGLGEAERGQEPLLPHNGSDTLGA